MVSGGTRFGRRERPRPAARAADVEVRPPHKTLYEVLVVPPSTPSRQIRRIARALRSNLPNLADLDDVCLAEQVLGRRELRAEYDALLARARAAKLTLPQIGAAIEGSRPPAAAPAPVPPPIPRPAPFSSLGRAREDSSDQSVKILLRVGAAAAVLLIGAVGRSGKHDTDRYRMPELRPIQVPRFEPLKIELPKIEVPRIDLHEFDKLDPAKLDSAKIDRAKLGLPPDRVEPPRHKPPRPPAKPPRPDPAPPETP